MTNEPTIDILHWPLLFEVSPKLLLQFLHLRINVEATVRLVRVVFVKILVVIFCHVKIRIGFDGRYNGIIEIAGSIHLLFVFFGDGFLILIVVKNNRTVLRPNIGSLPVQGGGIMRFPEYFQQLLIADFLRVILNLNRLGVSGISPGNLLVRRILDMASGIAGCNLLYTF